MLETHGLGDGAPDLIVGYQDVTALVEVKNGARYHQTPRENACGSSVSRHFYGRGVSAWRSWRKRQSRFWQGSPRQSLGRQTLAPTHENCCARLADLINYSRIAAHSREPSDVPPQGSKG